jgi:anti-sigma factor RsiW
MTCRQSRRLFSRRLDERLNESERQALDAHLSGCAACRAELARWEVPSRALRALGPAAAPDDLAERGWRAALAANPAGSFEERFVWAARRFAAAGAVAAALVWGGVLWRGAGEAASGSAPTWAAAGSSSASSAELALAPEPAEMALALWAADLGETEGGAGGE